MHEQPKDEVSSPDRDEVARICRCEAGQCIKAVRFSLRERQVLLSMVDCPTDYKIARNLHISVPTVRKCVLVLLQKTSSRSRLEAARKIIRCHLTEESQAA